MQEENWLIGSAASAKLVNLPLPTCPCSMETEFFLEKEHQFNHNFPSLFISNNTLNADKCTLLHRTISVLDINKLWLNTFLPIPVLQQFIFLQVTILHSFNTAAANYCGPYLKTS